MKVLLAWEVFSRKMIFLNKSMYLIRNSNSWKLYSKYYIYAIKRWFHENTWLIVFSSISSRIFLTTIPYGIIIIIATINAVGKRRLRGQKNRPIFFISRVSRAAGTLNATIDEPTFFIITSTVLFPSIVGTFFAFHPDLYDHQSDKSVAIVGSLYRLLSQRAKVKKLSEKTVSSFPSIDSLDTNDDHDDRVVREETRNVVEQLAEREDGQTLANRIDR